MALECARRGQAAARKLKRDAARKARKAAAAQKWDGANALRAVKKVAKRRAKKATREGTTAVPGGAKGVPPAMAPSSLKRAAAYTLEPGVDSHLLGDAARERFVGSVLSARDAKPRVPSRARPGLVRAAHGGDSELRRMSTGWRRRQLDAHLHTALKRGGAFLAVAPAEGVLALGAQQAPAKVLE